MTDIVKILQWIAIGMLLGVVCFLLITKCSTDKKNIQLSKDLYACVHSPSTTDTVWDTITIHDTTIFKPIPISGYNGKDNKEQVHTSGTAESSSKESICEERYSEIYNFKGGRFRWKAYIKGCKIEEMSFPEISIPEKTIYVTQTVDTCISKEPAYKVKNHLGMDLNFGLQNFKQFPNTELLFFYGIKDRVKINIGGEYNFYFNEPFFKIGMGVYFN
jgi:hypothetical protein